MRRHLSPAVLLIATIGAPAQALAQNSDTTRSTADGVYTDAQARRGAAIMAEVCSACHFEDEFTGPFLRAWNGATVAALFEVVSTTMPQDSPGSLEPEEYADLLAYVFSLNGIPQGDRELPHVSPALEAIRIDWRP
jgi:mono/diheme cytochrome c family protein